MTAPLALDQARINLGKRLASGFSLEPSSDGDPALRFRLPPNKPELLPKLRAVAMASTSPAIQLTAEDPGPDGGVAVKLTCREGVAAIAEVLYEKLPELEPRSL